MRRRRVLLAIVAIALLAMPMPALAEEGGWFDVDNCAMCQNLSAEKGLLENVDWEIHTIAAGALMITQVNPDFREAFGRANKNMEAVGQRLEQGEQMHLCPFCMSYGNLMMRGAKVENIQMGDGKTITVMSAHDTDVIAAIHTHAERTVSEYEDWKAQREGG